MLNKINFLGLSISSGQPDGGLSLSTRYARDYLFALQKMAIEVNDQGDISQPQGIYTQVHCETELSLVDWSSYEKAYQRIEKLLQQSMTLLNWGGDHSVGLSSVGAFCKQHPEGYVVWIDAHADLNVPASSPTGNLHGMPLALLLNINNVAQNNFPWLTRYLNSEKLIYLGVRDLDPFERHIIRQLGIKCFTAEDVRQKGMLQIAQSILDLCRHESLHISFDIDSVSPEYAPSTGVPVTEGLTPQDLKIFAETISHHQKISSIDVVEINPTLGGVQDVHATFMVAMIFLKAIFCSRITNRERGFYDVYSRTRQTFDSTSVERGSQVQT